MRRDERKELVTFEKILDLLFPRRCPICDRVLPVIPVSQKQRICPECLSALSYLREPFCLKCGKPIAREASEYCEDCTRKKHFFLAGRSVFVYRGRMKDAMYRFKYSGRREYAEFFAEEAVRCRKKWLSRVEPEVIVPVPMYAAKKRRRGYNQAEDFARALGKRIGTPVRTDLITRVRNTAPMKGLSEKERRQNMKHAFSVDGAKLRSTGAKRILLVDDIYTTGSTIDAMARALLQEQEVEIYFLSICIGRD